MQLAFAGVFGAVAGSFLNVLAYRLPRHESIVAPASHCTSCGTPIRPYDNIPIISWLLLRGRCRKCSAPISARYPLIELATGALCVSVLLARSSSVQIALGILLVLLVLPCAAIDLEHRVIPNALTAPAAVLALALGLLLDPSGEPARLIAAGAGGGVFLVAAIAKPAGMGMGDVKLAGVMGLCLGSALAPALMIALFAGVLTGAVVAVSRGAEVARRTKIPFGPFLALGALAGIFLGPALVHWYASSLLH